jgi:predicted RNA-binding protein YlqC (UPF0109 family)
VSAFDDEFGLFSDEAPVDEERKSTLGARKIASGNETIIDEIEPEDERPARRPRGGAGSGGGRPAAGEDRYPRRERGTRPPVDPAASQARAAGLLEFLAKKLVDHPDAVLVAQLEGERGPIIELEVAQDDIGKVIGRGGRVAQALRTLVRASAEGRVIVDIVDSGDDDVAAEEDLEHTPPVEDAGEPAEEDNAE